MNSRQFTQNLPMLKIFVLRSFLTQDQMSDSETFTECYLISVKSIYGRPLLFTVYTVDGALYSNLPIHSLYLKPSRLRLTLEESQPYSCISDKICIIKYEFLKDFEVEYNKIGKRGSYLFTIDYYDEGLAEDPEQYKSHNIIALEDGNLVALPNNYCHFIDGFFSNKPNLNYKRCNIYWKGSK